MSLGRLLLLFGVVLLGMLFVASLLIEAGIVARPETPAPEAGPPDRTAPPPTKLPRPLPAVFDRWQAVASYQAELEETSFLSGQEGRWVILEWWEGPDRFRSESRRVEPGEPPDERIFVSDGQTAWFYQPTQGLVIISQSGELELARPFVSSRAELATLLSPKAKGTQARWEGPGRVADRDCAMLLVWEGQATVQQRVCLDHQTLIPLRLETIDPSLGVLYRTEYLRVEFNIDLPDDLFVFQVPPGVEVIDQRS